MSQMMDSCVLEVINYLDDTFEALAQEVSPLEGAQVGPLGLFTVQPLQDCLQVLQ